MNPFRNVSFKPNLSRGKVVLSDHKLQTSIKDGVQMTELVKFDDDYTQAPPLIRREDFTLKKQLQAGVQMNRVNVSGMLNPSDPATAQLVAERNLTKDFENLQSEMSESEPSVSEPPVSEPSVSE